MSKLRGMALQGAQRPNVNACRVCGILVCLLSLTVGKSAAEQPSGTTTLEQWSEISDEEMLAALPSLIAGLTPEIEISSELVPAQVRLIGCDRLERGGGEVKRASHFEVVAYFEFLPAIESPFKKELLVTLGEIDIARIPIQAEEAKPGQVVKRNLPLYVPRSAHLEEADLRVGFIEDNAPGERHGGLAPKMATLLAIDIRPGDPVEQMQAEQKRALWQQVAELESRNLIANGGFELGKREWNIDNSIWEGKGGWERILSVSIDPQVAIEGLNSLRIDFGGGQDPEFYHVTQDVGAKPSTEYVVSYFVKTHDLTSNEGPSIVIRDRDLPLNDFYKATPMNKRLTGTNDWALAEFKFVTAPTTTRLRVIIRRHGSGPTRYQPDRFGPVSGTALHALRGIHPQMGPGGTFLLFPLRPFRTCGGLFYRHCPAPPR